VDRRHHHRSEGQLAARHEEIRREGHPVAVEEAQQRFHHPAQELQRQPDGKQEIGRQMVDSEPHPPVARHDRSRRLVRRAESVGIKVEEQPVVAPIHGGEEIPLVPADARHALEEREHVHRHRGFAPALGHTAHEPVPATGQRPRQIAGDVSDEPSGGGQGSGHRADGTSPARTPSNARGAPPSPSGSGTITV
jgi:hypothetical protein